MKIREWLILMVCAVALPFVGSAQCGTVHTISFDTTVTGGGSAYPGYSFTMPKFNPALGTLTSVRVASVVTLGFSYTVENNDVSARTTKVRVERTDTIVGPTASDTLANDYYTAPRSFPQSATDHVPNSGPDFTAVPKFYILHNDTVLNRTFTATAGYLGAGGVSFQYKSDVGQQTNGNPNSNIQGAASDTIKFSISYTYCDNILLAAEITSFTATRKDSYIDLQWNTTNENSGRSYEIQRSYDGKNFVTIATLPSQPEPNLTGAYVYNYLPLSNESGKLYFRIRQIDHGTPKYSVVRLVDLGGSVATKPDIRLVPNPSNGDFSVMMINSTTVSDWTIELFNIKGQVISTKQAVNSTLDKFPIRQALSAGVYFVLVTNKKNRQKFVERMIVN